MKKIYTIITIVAIALSCENTNDNEINLTGKFRSGEEKQLIGILQNDNLFQELIYDSLKRITEINIYYSDSLIRNEKYFYNSQGQLIMREYDAYTDYYNYKNGLLTEKYSTYENNPDWNPKTIFHYDSHHKKIIKAENYFNNTLSGYIKYDYDGNGNTVSRKIFSNKDDNSPFLLNEIKCRYDNKINPRPSFPDYPADMKQKNNVIYYYYYSVEMSTLPPEYNSEFEYDHNGHPVEETRYNLNNFYNRIMERYTYIYKE